MPPEPREKRAVVFVDGQNLFYSAKEAFGCEYPNYDPNLLGQGICLMKKWIFKETHFYTGVPDRRDDAFWNHFWVAKMAVMGTRGVYTFSRRLHYRNQTVILPDGKATTILVGQEKGIDIRIALDVVRLARDNQYDVAIIFSQDQDLSEVADEVKYLSKQQNRWIKVACAFPVSPTYHNNRGINGTEWIEIDRKLYCECLDSNDYRLK